MSSAMVLGRCRSGWCSVWVSQPASVRQVRGELIFAKVLHEGALVNNWERRVHMDEVKLDQQLLCRDIG